jgi:hypothetical protein
VVIQHTEAHFSTHGLIVLDLALSQLTLTLLVVLRGLDSASAEVGCALRHLNFLLEQHIGTSAVLSFRAGLLVLVGVAAFDRCALFDG